MSIDEYSAIASDVLYHITEILLEQQQERDNEGNIIEPPKPRPAHLKNEIIETAAW